MQDRIALKYQKDIKRELKLTASQLAESYRINQSTVEYPQIQNEHQKRITEILLELAKLFIAHTCKPPEMLHAHNHQ